MMASNKYSGLWLASAGAAGCLPMLAAAQGLEEVVVTAQRRETNLQQTPISVTAFSAEEMQLRNMFEGRDLTVMVPNFFMGGSITNERTAQLFMRGVPGVGIYLDGVWQGNVGAMFASLLEMERVEVLRGPQGTLFGRHTNGGAIQYVTAPPSEEFGINADIEIGNYNREQISLTVDAPVSDAFKTKWLVAKREADGYIESITAPISFGGFDDTFFRGDLLWDATEDVSLRLTYQKADQIMSSARYTEIHIPQHRLILPYNVAFTNPAFRQENGGTLPNHPFTIEAQNACGPRVGCYENTMHIGDDALQIDSEDVVLDVQWDITDNLSVRSLTGVNNIDSQTLVDFDSTNFQEFTDDLYDTEEEISQEFHLSGTNLDGRLSWLVGTYYRKSEQFDRNYRWTHHEFYEPTGQLGDFGCNVLPCPAPNQEMVDYVRQWGLENDPAECLDADPSNDPDLSNCMVNFNPLALYNDSLDFSQAIDRALFGEVNFDVTDRLTATVGVRFTEHDGYVEDMEATSGHRPYEIHGNYQGSKFEGIVTETEHDPDLGTISTPRLSVQYQLDDDKMLYASYAEGFTAAQVNNVNIIGIVELEPEVLATREFGLRSDWLGGSLRYNATVFLSKWTGLRVNNLVVDPETGEVLPFPYETSSGVAEVSGTEHELVYTPSDVWRVNLSLATLDTEYLNVGDPEVSPIRKGDEFGYASDLSYSLGVTRFWSLPSGGQFTGRLDYGWKSEYQKDSAPRRQTPEGEPAYGLLNARLVYALPDRDWRISVWGKNLTDEYYDSGGINADSTGVNFLTLGRPREYGLAFEVSL